MASTRLGILTDLHDGQGSHPKRNMEQAQTFCRRAVDHFNHTSHPDLVWVLGDLVDDPGDAHTAARYAALHSILETLRMPWRILPGNHDWEESAFYEVFPRPPLEEDLAGLRVMAFLDEDAPGYCARRSADDLVRMQRAREDGWAGPLISLQHMSFHPPGIADCPFNLENHADAMMAMGKGQFSLSLGAHHHAGLDCVDGKQRYIVCRALCEQPYPITLVDIDLDSHRIHRTEAALG
jgi:calcineurin-like phosphoesterase family protein